MNEKQKERQQRGNDFQAEIRRSWRKVPNSWRRRIVDGEGGTQPADEIILTVSGNILAEHKRTIKDRLELSFLRPNQIKGLLDFDRVLPNNYGLVFVSFLNETLDEAYAIRLVTALKYMKAKRRKYITRDELQEMSHVVQIPLLPGEERAYDLKEVAISLPFM